MAEVKVDMAIYFNRENEVLEEEIKSLDEAKEVIRQLKDKCRTQSQQILAWRRRLRAQVNLQLMNSK